MPQEQPKKRFALINSQENWARILVDHILPISRVAQIFSTCIKEAKEAPVVITQNGYASAILLSVEDYVRLRDLAEQGFQLMLEEEKESKQD